MVYGEYAEQRRKAAIKFMIAFERAVLENVVDDK